MTETAMNAIDMLESQHREVEDLFEQFEKASRPATQRRLVEDLSDMLTVHATIEEKHFYPAVRSKETEDILLESLEEHLAAKRLLADLLDLQPTDETFAPKVKVLKEQIEHHVKEEEEELFPKVKKLMNEEELNAIAQEMMATQVELEAAARPRDTVREETAQAATLP